MMISIYSMQNGDNPGDRYVQIDSHNVTHPVPFADIRDMIEAVDGVYGVRFPQKFEDNLFVSFQVDEPAAIGQVIQVLLANGVYQEQRMT